jgi:tryptophan synthase alpha chain
MMPLPAAAHLSALLERRSGPRPLVVYLPAGFPTMGGSAAVLERAVREGGASCILLGVPYHTPHLDGLDITRAHIQALRSSTAVADVLALVRELAPVAPVVVKTYAAEVLRYGAERWAEALAYAGAAGCLVADLPEDEAPAWHRAADAYGLHAPRLLEHTAQGTRVTRIANSATGWLQVPAAPGVTGYQGPLDIPALERRCSLIRLHNPAPLVLGGGISTPSLAAELAPLANGMVIGSPLIRTLLDNPGPTRFDAAVHLVSRYTNALRQVTAGPVGNAPRRGKTGRRDPGTGSAA